MLIIKSKHLLSTYYAPHMVLIILSGDPCNSPTQQVLSLAPLYNVETEAEYEEGISRTYPGDHQTCEDIFNFIGTQSYAV